MTAVTRFGRHAMIAASRGVVAFVVDKANVTEATERHSISVVRPQVRYRLVWFCRGSAAFHS